jgi:hypothetical protein
VQWVRVRGTGHYQDCHDTPVDRFSLERFPVLTRQIGDKVSVFVDLRTTTPPTAAPR